MSSQVAPLTTQSWLQQRLEENLARGQSDLLQSLGQLEHLSPALASHGAFHALQLFWSSSQGRPISPWISLFYYLSGRLILSGKDDDPRIHDYGRSLRHAVDLCPAHSTVVAFRNELFPSIYWDGFEEVFREGGDFNDRIQPPSPEQMQHHQRTLQAARSLITALDPALAHTLEWLQSLIVFAKPHATGSGAMPRGFGGATTFFFRGGSIFNGGMEYSLARMLDRMIHEAAHAELFVLSQDQPLCLNSDEDRHQVSIRPDPRPMNGILHAYFVSVKVKSFCAKAILYASAGGTEAAHLQGDLQHLHHQYTSHGRSCWAIIQTYARFTASGQALFERVYALDGALEPIS